MSFDLMAFDPDADPQLDEWMTHYSIDSQLIYAAFAWSKRTLASAMFAALAVPPTHVR
jgi:hypothetical protein